MVIIIIIIIFSIHHKLSELDTGPHRLESNAFSEIYSVFPLETSHMILSNRAQISCFYCFFVHMMEARRRARAESKRIKWKGRNTNSRIKAWVRSKGGGDGQVRWTSCKQAEWSTGRRYWESGDEVEKEQTNWQLTNVKRWWGRQGKITITLKKGVLGNVVIWGTRDHEY